MRPALTAAAAVVLLGVAACGAPVSPAAQPRTAQAGAVPIAAVAAPADCSDGLAPVASFQPAKSDPEDYFSDRTIAAIRSKGYLLVGTSGDVLLWGYRDPKDAALKGFDIDLLGRIADSLGVGIRYRVINYANRIPALNGQDDQQNPAQKVDIVAHTMTINCKRWAQINFSTEYYDAGQRVLVRYDPVAKKPEATTIEQFKGKDVCVAVGSTNLDELNRLNTTLSPKINIVTVPDLGQCMVKFQQGEADAVSGDDTVLAGFAEQDQYSQVVGPKFTSEPYGLGFNKADRAFTEYVNLLLEKWRSDGTLADLGRTYMKSNATAVPKAVYGRTANTTDQ